jgi:hypothetical protein
MGIGPHGIKLKNIFGEIFELCFYDYERAPSTAAEVPPDLHHAMCVFSGITLPGLPGRISKKASACSRVAMPS